MGSVSAAWTAPPGPARPSAQTGGAPGFTGPASDSNAPGAGRTPPLAGVAFVRLQLAPGLCGNRCTVLLRQLPWRITIRSEEHTSELQSLMRNSYAVFCLKKKKK